MRPARTPRERWVGEGLRALAAGGSDAVRVEALAQALGVTKGSFYWHFADRRALLAEMLASWERTSVDAVIAAVEQDGPDPRGRLRRLFALAASGDELRRVDLAIRDWSRRDAAVARRLRRVDNRRMDYMRSLFGALCADPTEVEVRCTLAFALFVGSPFMAVDHPGRRRAEVLAQALERLLDQPAGG